MIKCILKNLKLEDENCETYYDEEKGFEEWLDHKKEECCYYNLCLLMIQLLKYKIRQKVNKILNNIVINIFTSFA